MTATAVDCVDGLIELFATLGGLLAEETAAVRARDYGRLTSLSERKGRLVESYGTRLHDLGENGARAGALEPGLAARLRASAREFLALLEANARILNASKTAHERLIRAIGDAVAAKARPASGYSKTGSYGSVEARTSRAAVPIALNESI
jgi:hypothetical protein